MPYTAKGKCVYRKDTGKKVGCTKGSVKKYLAALHANVKDVNESEEFDWVKDMDPLEFIRNTFKESDMEYGQLVNGSYTLSVEVPEETNYSYYEEKSIQKELRRRIGVDCYFSMARGGDDELLISITVDSKEELVKVIDWMESDNNLRESEEFDWVPNEVDLNDHRVLYLIIEDTLKNSNFKIVKEGSVYHIEDEYGDIYFYISERDFNIPFIYHEIKDSIQFLKYEDDNEMLPYFQKLMSLLSPLYKNNIDKLFKPIKESEEWYDEVLNEKPLLRFDDLKVGDVVSNLNPKFNNLILGVQDSIYFHIDSFKEATTHRNGYAEKETVAVCSLMRENPDTGNYYGISRETIDLVRGNNKPVWTLIYREGVMESINESENDFEWVGDIIDEGVNIGDFYKINLEYPIVAKVEDIIFDDSKITSGNSGYVVKVRYFNDNEEEEWGDQEEINLDWVYDLINGDDHHWVKVTKEYAENMFKDYEYFKSPMGWVYDKNISESEDDFEWAKDIVSTPPLEFNDKEIMIDIQDLDEEELKKLYEIVSPYISKSDRFTTNEGDNVIWKDNDKCFKEMLTNGSGKFKTISLHCGIEDNDYLPLKGALCCLKTTYQEEIIQPYMSEMDANLYTAFINGRDLIGYTINESEWFEDVVKDPIMLKVEELEMGDIVIPTRFNQQEYIVTGKGTSVKLLHEPTHWVTLKRNTKENTGGVFIEHDSEIGKACRFELIHREENLNESEEFEWAENIIANTTEEIDISNNFDLWKNKLVEGSVVKITGRWEDMYFEDDVATIVNSPDEVGNHLLKFDRIIYEFGNEDEGNHTHCGENETQNIKCECQRKQNNRDEVGKCWWTNLSFMEKIIYLPFEGKQITESEEDSELFWAEDLLDFNNPINITDKLDVMEELPVGSILQVQGYQDDMEFDMEEVKLIDKAEDKDFDSTYYLFKLKYERGTGNEMTHCGNGQKNRKICECRDENENDEISQTEIGKCWWIELKKQDKVIYYPNRIDLTENKKKKPLLTEGRYDAITRKVVRDIMKLVTTSSFGDHDLPYDINNEEYEYQQENLGFSVELQIVKTEKVEDFFIDAATSDNDDDETVMLVKVFLNPTFDKQNLEKLFYKLQEVIRHEIEHFTQHGPYRIEDRPIYKGDTANLKTVYGHHKNVIEVPALVHGFYRRAKLEKRPLDEIMMEDLDSEIEKGFLTKNQAQKLLTIWVDYAKKNLPAAVYKEN